MGQVDILDLAGHLVIADFQARAAIPASQVTRDFPVSLDILATPELVGIQVIQESQVTRVTPAPAVTLVSLGHRDIQGSLAPLVTQVSVAIQASQE